MQKSVDDSVRSDIESFRGIRQRAPSETSTRSSSDSSDGYESDNTLDNISEIVDSESELERSTSSESLCSTSEHVANSRSDLSSQVVDSTTFREHWIPVRGVQVTVTIRDRKLDSDVARV